MPAVEKPRKNQTSSQKCPHGRAQKGYYCKECLGKGICPHLCQKSQCKDCGGSQICTHGRQRSRCRECGGSQICVHGRRRSRCIQCGGGSLCEHGRRRNCCQKCRKVKRYRRCPHNNTFLKCPVCSCEPSIHLVLKSGIFDPSNSASNYYEAVPFATKSDLLLTIGEIESRVEPLLSFQQQQLVDPY